MTRTIERDAAAIQSKFRAIAKAGAWVYEMEKSTDADSWSLKYARMRGWIHPNGTDARFRLIYKPDGDRIRVTLEAQRQGTSYITPRDVGQPNPDITVAFGRNATAIARDIERRFLPNWRTVTAAITERIRQWDVADNDRQQTRLRLCKLIDGASIPDHMKDGQNIWTPLPYHEVGSSSRESVCVGIRYVPLDLAEQIITVVEQWRKDHPDTD